MGGVAFLGAEEDGDAVVAAGDDQGVAAGVQAGGAAAAQAVGEREGVDVVAGVELVERLLEGGAQDVGAVVEADFEEADGGDVAGAGGGGGDFTFEHGAGDQGEAGRVHGAAGVVSWLAGWRRAVAAG